MAKNKTTYTLQIDAELGNLESKLSSVKGLLSGVLGSASAPKGLEKTIEKIEGLIDRVRAKASQPIDSKAGFASVSKDVDSAQIALSGLLKIVQSINSLPEADRLSFLPPDAQAQIQKVVDGLSAYAAAMDAATTESQELAAARAELAKADEKVAKAQERLDQRTASLDAAKAEKQAAEDAIQAIEDRKKKLAELRAEQEKIEKFYDTPDENGQKRNKSKKYSEVSMRPQDIKRKVADMEKAVAGDDAAIEGYREQLKGAKSDIDSYIHQVSTANRTLRDATTEHDTLAQKVQDLNDQFEASKPQNQQAAFDALHKQAQDLGVSLDGIGTAFSDADASELIKRLVEIKTKGLDKVGQAADKATVEVGEFGEGLKNIKGDIDEGTDALEKMTEATAQKEAFESKIKQFLGLSGAAQLMRMALRDAMATIKELDATMAEMAVVTDLTVGDYWDQLPEYSKRASDLGVSINSAYKAATLYYQQGLKTNEVVALSNETLKMAKIAGIDAAEATDKMTAALRGFNMELNEASAQKIADVYSELAAITAADVDEISTAMTKTASIASSAGMEFETTAAFLSQIIETTRESAETAGTAMKTVIARFQELKKSPDEIGEIDGEIVDANAIETALRSVGVSLRDAKGQFRELDDVFLELSSKWSGLDKNTQRYIATIAAGSRQQSRFIAMMQDYSRTQELVTAANTSAGASQKQFEKTMESLEARVEKLKNAWHEFTMGIMNSDLVKFGVDVLTKFLEIVNKATSAFDGMGGSIMKIATTLAVFKLGSKIFDKLKAPLQNFFAEIIRKAGETGEQAANAAADGVKKAQQAQTPKTAKNEKSGSSQQSAEQKILKQKIASGLSDRVGLSDWDKAQQKFKTQKEVRSATDKVAALKKKKASMDQSSIEEIKKVDAEIKKAEKDLKEYADYQNKLGEDGKTAWQNIGDGIQKMGETAIAAGIGVSMLGGLLTSMGLEEVGEGIAWIGNLITMAGTTITTIIPIVKTLSAALVSGGISAQAAWWWAILIVAAVAALVVGIIAIANAVKNASPEKKLEEAQESAKAAEEAANDAAEAYEKLGEALDNLGDKYKALDELTKGTKEWNKAVQEINSSVLDLIGEYPELAKFVENKEGVLTIDVESSGVQEVLQQAEARKTATKNTSTMANVAVSQASNEVAYSNLDKEVTKTMGKQNAAAAGWGAALGAVGTGAGTGAGVGALIGASTPIFGPILAGPAAALGAAIGGIAGAIGGAFSGPAAKKAAEENNEKVKQSTDELAKALASGEILPTEERIAEKLEGLGYLPEEAKKMAKELAENADELRSYGESLNATDAQQQAAYDAIAFSAQSLANTLDMTAEQIQQSAVLVDGETSERFYNEKKDELDKQVDEDSGSDIKDLSKDDDAKAAIEKQYGTGAYMDKKGNVYDKKGEKIDKLTSDELIAIMSTQYATNQTAKAIEYSDEAIKAAGSVLGENAINTLYSANEGTALTQSDLDTLNGKLGAETAAAWSELTETEKKKKAEEKDGIPQSVKEAWEAMGDAQLAYGNDIVKFMDDLAEGVVIATSAFEKAGDAARDFMTADMAKGFKNKLDEVAEMAGGEDAAQAVMEKTVTLLGGTLEKDANGEYVRDESGKIIESYNDSFTEEQRQEIQSRINATDWSNLEQLLSLQIDLEQQYGISYEEAKAYVDELAEASYATSGLTSTIKVFGELWKATEKINQSLTRLTKLQWEYERAIEGKGGDISSLMNNILEEYRVQIGEYQNAYNASNEDIAKLYAQGGINYGIDLRQFATLGEYGLEVDNEDQRLQDAIDSGKITQEQLEGWVDSINEQYATSQEQVKGLQDTLDNIEELEQQGKDAYYELRNMAKEAILDSLQQQIDLQQETLDATRDANAVLINKLQGQIDDNRQARENQKTEENISKLQSQQAYLAMDTSGANALQMQDVDKQIKEAEQAYQDQLVDQAIQNLQDANAKAEEQRERQIALAESSLEAYQLSNEFQTHIDSQLAEMLVGGSDWQKTGLGNLIADKFTKAMSAEEKTAWATAIGAQVDSAVAWRTTDWDNLKSQVETALTTIDTNLSSLATHITGKAANMKVSDQVTKLRGAGFEEAMSAAGIKVNADGSITDTGEGGTISEKDEEVLNKMTTVSQLEGSASEISSLQSKITEKRDLANEYNDTTQAANFEYLTKEDFYKNYSVDSGKFNVDGTEYNSYTDYLTKMSQKEVSGITNLNPEQAFGGIAVEGEYSHLSKPQNWSTGEDFDATVNSKKDKIVELGGLVENSDRIKLLDHIYNQTGNSGTPYVVLKAGTTGLEYDMLFIRQGAGKWRYVRDEGSDDSFGEHRPVGLIGSAMQYLGSKQGETKYRKYKFETGGLADFTGPAWLDGTPSRPEYILNAAQTERFFSLIDVLEGYDTKGKTEKTSGDNYFDIDINVEKIDNDYDMEQIADKIRRMIYDDATYRNVNAISHIR